MGQPDFTYCHVIPGLWAVSLIRLLVFLLFIQGIYAQETEPTVEQIAAAICQIETGTTWDGSRIHGSYSSGKAGEKGPWQITPEMLRKTGGKTGSFDDFVLAYAWFRDRSKNWRDACAAYHRGLNGNHKKAAKDYMQRVEALILSQSIQ
jgi:hypothetical protein